MASAMPNSRQQLPPDLLAESMRVMYAAVIVRPADRPDRRARRLL